MTTTTYMVHEGNLGPLVRQLSRLKRKAVKLGVGDIVVAVGEPYAVTFPVDNPRSKNFKDDFKFQTVCDVTISGETPQVEGHILVGTIQHLGEAGVVLRSAPDQTIPPAFRDKPKTCEHCNLKRNRIDTYVVLHIDSGTYRQIGRNCLADYLGGRNPHDYAEFAEVLTNAFRLIESEDDNWAQDGGSRATAGCGIEGYLTTVATFGRVYGFLTKGAARGFDRIQEATANRAWGYLMYPDRRDKRTRRHTDDMMGLVEDATNDEREADGELAVAALEWAVNLTPRDTDDYLLNIQVIANHGWIENKTAGLAASIESSYKRQVERDEEFQQKIAKEGSHYAPANEQRHFGTERVREEFILTLVADPQPIEGEFGVTLIYRFATPDGNAAVWFSSNGSTVNNGMVKGETYRVKATVKRHGDYRGRPQTTLTRLKVIEGAHNWDTNTGGIQVNVKERATA